MVLTRRDLGKMSGDHVQLSIYAGLERCKGAAEIHCAERKILGMSQNRTHHDSTRHSAELGVVSKRLRGRHARLPLRDRLLEAAPVG